MSNTRKSHSKLVILILFIIASLSMLMIYYGVLKPIKDSAAQAQNIKVNGIFLPTPQSLNDFSLTDNSGKEFTKESLKGRWTLMFFGFTNCGIVCPTTMAALNKMYRTLQEQLPDNRLPRIVMVSVDPERDTVARMNEYVSSFNPHFKGVRGDEAATDALEKQFHIAAAKMQAEGGKDQYTINHTAEILVINPRGELQAFLSYPHKPEQMVKDYKALLSTGII